MKTSTGTGARPLYTTPAGLRRLRQRLAAARAAYFEVCDSNEDAAGAGDSSVWHDNFAYEENQRLMHQLARRIKDLEVLINQVQIVRPAAAAPDRVAMGARVELHFLDDDSKATYLIAGWEDGDPEAGRLSYASPLGRALIGAEEGEVRLVRLARQVREVEVAGILAAPDEEVQ